MTELQQRYKEILTAVSNEQTRILRGASKTDYFKEKGIDYNPNNSDVRWDQKDAFLNAVPADYESALLFFEPDLDRDDADWINILGFIYNKIHNNPLFDPERADFLFLTAANKGQSSAMFNVAAAYYNGDERPKDLDAALYWYRKADKAGHYAAPFWISRVQMESDIRYMHTDHENFTRDVHRTIARATKQNSVEALVKAARLHASGKAFPNLNYSNIAEHIRHQKCQARDEFDKYSLIFDYALRTYLGLGCAADSLKAIELLGEIPRNSNDPKIRHTLRSSVDDFIKILEHEAQSEDKKYDSAKSVIRQLHSGKGSFQELTAMMEKNGVVHGQAMINVALCAWRLAGREDWDTYDDWKVLVRRMQAHKLGTNLGNIIDSTFTMGPTYNPIGQNGLPVLGVWQKASSHEQEAERHMLNKGSYAPEAGVVAFKGLTAEQGGTINFDCIMASDRPATLVPEDFEVALLLVFGHEDRVVQPYLSLESPADFGVEVTERIFSYKEWNPHWLGYTDFGQTLYATDELIGRLCWGHEKFEIGDIDSCFEPGMAAMAAKLIDDLTMAGGRQGNGGSSRVMLKPEHISLEDKINESGPKKQFSIAVREVKMRIDGSYIVERTGDGKEDRLVALNDTTFEQGRVAQMMTDRYSEISTLMPVFERARQMMGLFHSLKKLRELAFTPAPALLESIENKFKAMEALPSIETDQLLVATLPLSQEEMVLWEPK